MPLTSIERFHLHSGNSAHPNLLFCRVIIAGSLQRKPLEKALERVLIRHHIFSRRLAGTSQNLAWINAPEHQTSLLTWIQPPGNTPLDTSFMPAARDLEVKLDLHSTPGAHVWYQPPSAATHSMLFLAIHHSVADGLGGSRIINELVIVYDNLFAGRAWDDGLRRLDLTRLSQRHRLGLNRWNYWKHIWKQPIALAGMAKFLFRGFHVILENRKNVINVSNDESASAASGMIGRWISEELSAQIDRFANDKAISANSVAMASVFYALPNWSRQQNDASARKWLRMVLPISVASKDDLRSPITNRATIVQVDRCEEQMSDTDSFLHYLDREVKIIVGWQFDKLFLLIVRMMSLSRWWLRRSAADPRARGTIVFTNLGQPFRSVAKRVKKLSRGTPDANPPTEIIDFDYAGPTRSGMPLNFTIQRYQQRYRITSRFDQRVLASEQANRFLKQVENELDRITSPTSA